jgi:hypothetical protein
VPLLMIPSSQTVARGNKDEYLIVTCKQKVAQSIAPAPRKTSYRRHQTSHRICQSLLRHPSIFSIPTSTLQHLRIHFHQPYTFPT